MMKYTVRKLINILKYESDEVLSKFIMNNGNAARFHAVLLCIHKLDILKIYKERIGFENIDEDTQLEILTNAKLEKGKFLIDNGFNCYVNKWRGSNANLLRNVKDFGFFKYLLNEYNLPIDIINTFNLKKDVRFLKYIWDNISDKDKELLEPGANSLSLNKTLFLESIGKFVFNINDIPRRSTEEYYNYLFDKCINEGEKFKFLENLKITKYILKKMTVLNKEKLMFFLNQEMVLLRIEQNILTYAYHSGLINNIFIDPIRKYNILSIYNNPKKLKKFLLSLKKELRVKMLNEINEDGQNFIWGRTDFLSNFKKNDILFLIKQGLDIHQLNNQGLSFIESSSMSFDLKDFLINDINLKVTKINEIFHNPDYRSSFKVYINCVRRNNLEVSEKNINYYFLYNYFTYKDLKMLIDADHKTIYDVFNKDYSLFCNNGFYKKIMRLTIKELMNGNINRKDKRGCYIVYYYPPEYLSFFVKEGFNINLIPNNENDCGEFIATNRNEFFLEVKKIKLQLEKQKIKNLVLSDDKKDDSHNKKRM